MNRYALGRYSIAAATVLISLILSACGGTNVPDPHVRITYPADGAVIYVSQLPSDAQSFWHWNPGYITFRADSVPSSTDSTCPYPPFSIFPRDDGGGFRGLPLSPTQDSCSNTPPSPTFTVSWIPNTLGLNTISAEVDIYPPTDQLGGHFTYQVANPITVCVLNDPDHPSPDITIGRTSPTCNPVPLTPTPIVAVDSVQAYPNPIYYGDSCPSLSSLTFRAVLTLPASIQASSVQVIAHVGVVIGSTGNRSGSLQVTLLPDGTWDASTGGQVFTGTLNLSHSYSDPNNQLDLASLAGASGALLWNVTVTGSDGTNLGHSSNQVVSLSPCPAPGHNPPHNPGGSNPNGCSQYTNQTSCNLAGCSWNPQNSSCSVNQSRLRHKQNETGCALWTQPVCVSGVEPLV